MAEVKINITAEDKATGTISNVLKATESAVSRINEIGKELLKGLNQCGYFLSPPSVSIWALMIPAMIDIANARYEIPPHKLSEENSLIDNMNNMKLIRDNSTQNAFKNVFLNSSYLPIKGV